MWVPVAAWQPNIHLLLTYLLLLNPALALTGGAKSDVYECAVAGEAQSSGGSTDGDVVETRRRRATKHQKRRGIFPKLSTNLMRTWLFQHLAVRAPTPRSWHYYRRYINKPIYLSIYLSIVVLIIIGIPSPTHYFTLGLNPSFSANPPYRSLSFFSFRIHYMDFPDCLGLLLLVTSQHIRLFTFLVFFLFLHFFSCRFRAVD